MRIAFKCVLLITALLKCLASSAQKSDTGLVHTLINKMEAYNDRYAAEKLYLHFDKPYYAPGDTIWFKGYLLNNNGIPSARSIKLYVEMLNDSSRLLQQVTVPVVAGQAQGYFAIDNFGIAEGSVTIRAYTRWMQNFGEDAFFQKHISIARADEKTWLVTSNPTAKAHLAGTDVALALYVKDIKGKPVAYQDLELQVLNNQRAVLKRQVTTSEDGSILTTIPITLNKHKFTIQLSNTRDKDQIVQFPLYPTDNDIDLQFMPEGGNLVAGLYNKVAFKAVGPEGLGVNVTGAILNSRDEEVGTFASSHNGMGFLVLVPQPGETYTAKLKVNGIEPRRYKMPVVQATGTVMRVDNISNRDSLYLYLSRTPTTTENNYVLIIRSKGEVFYGADINMSNGFYNSRISKKSFPTGIVQLTLFNSVGRPVNERMVMIDHKDRLNIEANYQVVYAPKDSIGINLAVCDNFGKPVQGTFSTAITNDDLVKPSPDESDIVSHFLLTSEIRGNIENPAWYFKDSSITTQRALDNLLLTQGWTAFDWKEVFNPLKEPQYAAEADNRVSGRLTNLFKKPVVAQGLP